MRGSQSSLHRPSDGLQSGTRDRPTSAYIPQKDQYGSPQHGAVSSQVAFCASLKTLDTTRILQSFLQLPHFIIVVEAHICSFLSVFPSLCVVNFFLFVCAIELEH